MRRNRRKYLRYKHYLFLRSAGNDQKKYCNEYVYFHKFIKVHLLRYYITRRALCERNHMSAFFHVKRRKSPAVKAAGDFCFLTEIILRLPQNGRVCLSLLPLTVCFSVSVSPASRVVSRHNLLLSSSLPQYPGLRDTL